MIFSLQFAEPCQKDWFLPPEDPLGELSHLEMGLRRFCFENNCKVLLKIGYKDEKLFLDPDIALILDELPEKISQLLKDKKIELSFPESCMIIYFEPVNRQINCIWKKYGQSSQKNNFKLEKNEVLKVLEDFVCKIGSKAVDGGYITDKEKNEFLKPIIKQSKH
ncbi:hypothetical protein [Cylindrospermum sp. FACHB-282]|uniref:hypothetical protein n=1 Tax=Cylindrospermum sp. FACHB-282 TaxID=2692794 RepID=UPI001683FDED|nr:hypothetical protein [Cylindrospermum sp. FACHB-282]MBD2384790.1 hypothetical protein [Cylindrospermum sp. FACHB-282]